MISGLEILFLVILGWIFLMLYLSPLLKRSRNFSAYGPALMMKFTKNRGIIESSARHFPAKTFGKISNWIVIASAFLALFLLGYGAYLSIAVRTVSPVSLRYLVGLPILNPAIPIGFGGASLVAAVVIHEFFHGLVAKKHGIRIKSVGALFFVIPVGAFVEPDEKDMAEAGPVVRRRIVAAGPGINIVIAVITLILLTFVVMPTASPAHEGLYVESIDAASPASHVLSTGVEIISLGNYSGNSVMGALSNSTIIPGTLESLRIDQSGNIREVHLPVGVVIDSTIEGFPAYNASLPLGSIILSVDGTTIYNDSTLSSILDNTAPGTSIQISLATYSYESGNFVGTIKNYTLTTASKYYYYSLYDPSANSPSYKDESFIGVTLTYAGISGLSMDALSQILSGSVIFSSPWQGFLSFISLPLLFLSPIPSSTAALFSTPFSPIIFWGLVNSLYWLFWIDFLLGITNALPFFILDGGQFFKDSLQIASQRKVFAFLRNEQALRGVMMFLNLLVFLLLFMEIVIPRIGF
ncbi:MAG: site-2 protease family protein [Thermoplasmataceae archaeon]